MYYFEYLSSDNEDREFVSSSFSETWKAAEEIGIFKFRDTKGGEYFL